MHLREGEFSRAHTDFFEAFKNYDESGSPRCTLCVCWCRCSYVKTFISHTHTLTHLSCLQQASCVPQVPGTSQYADEVRHKPF